MKKGDKQEPRIGCPKYMLLLKEIIGSKKEENPPLKKKSFGIEQ